MSAAISLPFLDSVLVTVVVAAALAIAFAAPPDLRQRRWWPLAALAGGAVAGAGAVLSGLVPLLGQIHLSVYAVCMLGGFTVAWLLMRRRVTVLHVRQAWLIDAFLIALVLGVVGARARYVYERWDSFITVNGQAVPLRQALLKAADLDSGGAVWYGGALLATVGVWWYFRRRRAPLLAMADMTLPALIAGMAVGRIGCFFNGCCYGHATDLPWGLPSRCAAHAHPTQLYESAACAIIAATLFWWWRRRPYDGQVAALGVISYCAWRFFNESLRGDHDAFAWGGAVTTSQATSVYLGVAGMVMLVICHLRRRPVMPLPGTIAASLRRSAGQQSAGEQSTSHQSTG